MIALSNLKLFYKIALITALAVSTFLVTVAVSIYGANQVQSNLDNLQENIYPLIRLSNENGLQVQRIEELYTQAVATAEEELLEKAATAVLSIKNNLDEIAKYDKESSQLLSEIKYSLTQYERLNIDIATAMMSDNIDFNQITSKAKEKTRLYAALTKDVLAYQQNTDALFRGLIEQSVDESKNSIYTTVVIGVALLALMVLIATLVSRSIVTAASDIAESLLNLAKGEGNLSQRLVVHGSDELGQVSANFNEFMDLLSASISEVINVAAPLSQTSSNLSEKMEAVTVLANEQESGASNVNNAMVKMQDSVTDMSANAKDALSSSNNVTEEVTKGQDIILETINISKELSTEIGEAASLVNTLANDASDVNQFLNVIDDISSQTNLLALNAAIEAARAGEHGRGFAVVADEVRTLASRTSDATNNIKELVVKLGSAAQKSVDSMTSATEKSQLNAEHTTAAGEALNVIHQQVLDISRLSNGISNTTGEQELVATKVTDNVKDMVNSVESTRLTVQEVDTIVDKLTGFSTSLQKATSQFNL